MTDETAPTTSHGMLVLLPDARIGGVVAPLTARLAEAGCTVAAVAPTNLSPAVVARLYQRNLGRQEPGRVDGTWLGRRIFTLDQSIVLVLRSQVIRDLPGALAAWKGSSAPDGRTPGALRSVAAFANRCMSLLHTSDDAGQTAEDLALLLGPELRDEILGAEPDRQIGWNDVVALTERRGPDGGLSPVGFLATVTARALLVLGLDARLVPQRCTLGPLPELAADLLARRRTPDELGGLPVPELRQPPKDPFDAAVARRVLWQRQELTEVLGLIADGHSGGRVAEYAEDVLATNGVVNDTWERHMLLTTLTFPVREIEEKA